MEMEIPSPPILLTVFLISLCPLSELEGRGRAFAGVAN
jgi:hypothetical protein